MNASQQPERRKSWFSHPAFSRLWSLHRSMLACVAVLVPAHLYGQSTVQVTTATPLSVQLPQHVPMKTGQPLDCRLLYPLYVNNRIAIPAGVTLRGDVVRLDPDRKRRIHARFRGDFTPFHIPVVRFDQLVLANGQTESIASDPATGGVPILRLSPAPAGKRGGFFSRQLAAAKQQVKDTAAVLTAPGRGDRLVQFIYGQLPYHPQRIETGTTWTVELAKPLDLTLRDPAPAVDAAVHTTERGEEWQLRAYLQKTISSAKQKPGDTFQAWVSEPVFNAEHTLVVPEGSLLVGEITQTKAARSFGRQGKLRFKFREIKLPGGSSQPVVGNLSGIDSDKAANLRVDSEGQIQPKATNRVLSPLVLTLLAGRAFDDDGNQALNSAVASNGFGIVGRVVGIVASSRNVAAGIGIYGAALSFYDLWLARGKDVVFVKNTRIEVTTAPARNTLNTP